MLTKLQRPGPFTANDPAKFIASENFEYMASDITGPIDPVSVDGMRYCLHFVCLKSGWVFAYFLSTRDQAGFYLSICFNTIRSRHGTLPTALVLKSDNGGEYVGGTLKEVCEANEVKQIFMAPYLHEQNAHAEVVWRDVANIARAMLLTAGLDHRYWPLTYRHSAWLKNRMPNSGKGWSIPFYTINNEYPDLSVVRIFGCTAYSWIDPELRKKLDNKS
jgi:transposase InsO family protein